MRQAADRQDGRSAYARSFFKGLDDFGVLTGMARARAHMGKAQLLEQRSDIALVIVDAEALVDDALEIDAPRIRPGCAALRARGCGVGQCG